MRAIFKLETLFTSVSELEKPRKQFYLSLLRQLCEYNTSCIALPSPLTSRQMTVFLVVPTFQPYNPRDKRNALYGAPYRCPRAIK